MTELLDADARERIRTSLDESLLVEAGAGTGKTTVLVARLVEVLRTGHATIDELVVITFTEKAAAELAARVREGLEDAREATTDADERARLDAALRGLYRARIETIHAFATSLLRERPVESPVDPGLRVLDEVAASVLFSEVYDAWLDEVLAGGARRARAGRAPRLRHDAPAPAGRGAARASRGAPVRAAARSGPDAAAFLDAVETAADALRAELGACTNPDDRRGYRQALRLIEWVESAARAARRSGRGRAPRAVPRAQRAQGRRREGQLGERRRAGRAAHRGRVRRRGGRVVRRRAARRGDRRRRAARRGVRRALRGAPPRRRRRGLRRPARLGARPARATRRCARTSTSATAAS